MKLDKQTPQLTFAFKPLQPEDIFSPQDSARLSACCTLSEAKPLTRFDDKHAQEILADTEILVTGWGCPRIDAETLAKAPNLRLIAHAAGSVKGLLAPEVFQSGITVINAADANAVPVAQFTLAAILFANKQVFRFADLYHRERRSHHLSVTLEEPAGNWQKTIGIVGASRIGRRVIELLRPHHMSVLLYDPLITEDEAQSLGVRLVSLEQLVRTSDIVSLHAPSMESTRHMMDARLLSLMKTGATFINTARGSLVDSVALERELVSKRIFAVLDVTEPDVLPEDSPLFELENVLLTPHIAGALGTERLRLGQLITSEIERFLRKEPLDHALTLDRLHLQA